MVSSNNGGREADYQFGNSGISSFELPLEFKALLDGRPIYLTQALHCDPKSSDISIARFRNRNPGVRFVNARGRYRSRSVWFERWPKELDRYGGAIIMTMGEKTVADLSPCDEPTLEPSLGFHAVGETVFIEIRDLYNRGLPMLWHPVSPWRSDLISRFILEGLVMASNRHTIRLRAYPEAKPFRPAIDMRPIWNCLPSEL